MLLDSGNIVNTPYIYPYHSYMCNNKRKFDVCLRDYIVYYTTVHVCLP